MPIRDRFAPGQEPLYLIDGTSYIYRGFHALKELSRSDGFPTNALHVVLRLVLRILREERPRHALFVVDGRAPSFRADIFPAYKAQREKMPEDLARQIDPVIQGVGLLGLPVLREEGVEADDTIASLVARFKNERPVVIVGSDKDLRQCLDRQVVLWDPSGKQEKLVTYDDFLVEFPPGPSHWPDFQALTGDASDNIPGVPGIGPKTAAEITALFPSLEGVTANLDRLKPAWRAKIEPLREQLFVYRELTRLRTDAAPGVTLETLAVRPAPRDEAARFLNSYELRSLARELPADAPAASAQQPARPDAPAQLSLFGEAAAAPPAAALPDPTPFELLPSLVGRETSLVPVNGGFLIAFDAVQHLCPGDPARLAPLLALAACVATPSLKDLLASDPAWEAVPLERWFDLSLAAYLLAPEDRIYSWERLKDSLWSDPTFAPAEAPGGAEGLACLALARRLKARAAQAGLAPLLDTLEMPLIPVLVGMERAGIRIDREAFATFGQEVAEKLEKLTTLMHEQAGARFNVRSSQQLANVLYQGLGLKAPGKTPGGAASTSAEVLERLAGQHPLVDTVLEFRKLEKLRSTYLDPLPALADGQGRIHTTFNQLATATGRLSSSAPNLQNIPVRGELGKRMRALFTAAPGRLLASADYSQIELRVLAHFSKDPALLEAFRQGQDIHARTAALLFDKTQAAVTPEERRQAKTINFGLLYGMGPQKLGRELGLTLAAAKDFITRYFERMSVLKDYYQSVVDQAKETGSVTTLAGRRRRLPDIDSRNAQLESQARRQAVNTVIQGSAADIIKMAMLAAWKDDALRSLNARLILQVHDELVIEAPESSAHAAGERLRELMSGVVSLDVPVAADMGVGKDWSLAH
ncbi:DNA polymerase I, thermostable [Fundidesulfovibrio magnetotacticus]|uniref:DNA polymerase I n=1 Tax=Fundidesulfovibrio magnetotacticus TaxID=2730080 RepID=A0A6V8LNC5_9BACT|nr:DNA polymerase I [Fundidesulfovibrio magnetotacticus]GFK94133.1 DNA polymerase I, thermostable [Fundidesulfovibrio magnetotacticus]